MPNLILTYHAIELGPAPLCLAPRVFEQHLDRIATAPVRTVGITELARAVASGGSPTGTIAITFDDGFASVAETAVPMLVAHGFTATVFCVAGHLGGCNDWPSARNGGYGSHLADTGVLRALTEAGVEIGSHGMTHCPLVADDPDLLRREIVESRAVLENALGVAVRSFAYPYGAGPSAAARRLVEETYDAACTTRISTVRPGVDVYGLPRIDAHYVSSPGRLEKALAGSLGPYLLVRGVGARARRAVRADYARVA